jgi:hypothetical protein
VRGRPATRICVKEGAPVTATDLDISTTRLREMFQAPEEEVPDVDHLFAGEPRYIVQTPPARNDYKKASGSSDGAKTYDTMAT